MRIEITKKPNNPMEFQDIEDGDIFARMIDDDYEEIYIKIENLDDDYNCVNLKTNKLSWMDSLVYVRRLDAKLVIEEEKIERHIL